MQHELIDTFLAFATTELGLSENTCQAYRHDLERYITFCRDLGIDPVTASVDILASYLRGLTEAGYSTASVIRYVTSVQTFYGFLLDHGQIPANPVRSLDLPRPDNRLPDVLSRESMLQLLNDIDPRNRFAVRDAAILELFYASGLRVSELIGLQLDDWHPTLALMKVHGKGAKDRVVPVHPTAARALERYLDEQRPALLAVESTRDKPLTRVIFLSRSGLPLTRMAVWLLLRRIAAHAGVRPIHPHTLRHSFASHMLSGGANLRVIQEILGHEDINTTQRYTHVDLEHLREVHKKHPRQ